LTYVVSGCGHNRVTVAGKQDVEIVACQRDDGLRVPVEAAVRYRLHAHAALREQAVSAEERRALALTVTEHEMTVAVAGRFDDLDCDAA
jgi:hypothetical protein